MILQLFSWLNFLYSSFQFFASQLDEELKQDSSFFFVRFPPWLQFSKSSLKIMYLSNCIAQSNCIATTKRQKVLKVCDPVPLVTGNYLVSSFFLWQSQQSVKEASDNGRSSVWRRITLSKLGANFRKPSSNIFSDYRNLFSLRSSSYCPKINVFPSAEKIKRAQLYFIRKKSSIFRNSWDISSIFCRV